MSCWQPGRAQRLQVSRTRAELTSAQRERLDASHPSCTAEVGQQHTLPMREQLAALGATAPHARRAAQRRARSASQNVLRSAKRASILRLAVK